MSPFLSICFCLMFSPSSSLTVEGGPVADLYDSRLIQSLPMVRINLARTVEHCLVMPPEVLSSVNAMGKMSLRTPRRKSIFP